MRSLFLLLLSFAGSQLLAQTKEIAFKSHSGHKQNFNHIINDGLFDKEDGGFGLPEPTKMKKIKLDSVFYVSDTVSVIVVREYYDDPKEGLKPLRTGKDTLYHDELLGRKHALDSIRAALNQKKFYSNPVSSIVFVGYDNKKPKEKNKDKQKDKNKDKEKAVENNNIVPVGIDDNDHYSPFDGKFVTILTCILLVALLGGWLSWKYYQPRYQ